MVARSAVTNTRSKAGSARDQWHRELAGLDDLREIGGRVANATAARDPLPRHALEPIEESGVGRRAEPRTGRVQILEALERRQFEGQGTGQPSVVGDAQLVRPVSSTNPAGSEPLISLDERSRISKLAKLPTRDRMAGDDRFPSSPILASRVPNLF